MSTAAPASAAPIRRQVPYAGGKQLLAARIAELIPSDVAGYVEPFCGALSVLLAKTPSPTEVVNDLDHKVVTFWRVLRDRPADLERVCALTPHSREEAAEALAAESGPVDELELARQVWVALTQHRAAVMRRSGWRFTHGGNRMGLAAYLDGYLARIGPAAERLRRVALECRPALDVIATYGAHRENLLYVDPPYLGESRPASAGQYDCEMTSHAAHAELLDAITGIPARVIISGYHSRLYDQALADWQRIEIPARSAMGNPRTEVIWTNYTPPVGEETLPIPTT